MKILKSIIKFFSPLIYRLALAYWFIFRITTRGAKIVLTHGGEALLIKNTYTPDTYSLPGGGIGKGELPEDAVKREVKEELGILIDNPIYINSFLSSGEHKKDTIFVYTAELKNKDNIDINNVEIYETKWFLLNQLPPLGPITSKIFALYNNFTAKREFWVR